MDSNKEIKRKKDKHSDSDDYRSERRSKKRRSRSRTPNQERDKYSGRKRKHSKSKSPVPGKQEKRRDEAPNEPDFKSAAPVRKAKETDMLNTRTGGAYIPPARLRMMQAQITDKSSPAYQRLAWEALKKSIHGHINKINVGNIGIIIKELLKENIVRGRGLLCRSVIQAQAASPTFTNVYAALVAAVNSRFPNIGELLLKRLVIQFKRGFKRNDKPICISSASFVAHLVNQRVAHEILALELLTLLVETPTDDSVEVAIAFLKECGQKLTEVSSKGVNAIFEMLRNILHEGQLDKRVQYMIEVMFQVWKDGFKDHPAVLEELELVPEEEQFTHLLMLDDATDAQDILNVFKFDEKYEENEEKYKALSNEILGSDAESGEEGSDEEGDEDSEVDEEDKEKAVTIIDNTETNLVALRRTIYLTINSSLDFEECAHKLMKMQLKPGQEIELCHMFLDCCAEQRTYEKFYGLLAQRFCNINRIYISPFEEIFKDSYSTAHRLDTNRLRNVSKFFAHLLFTDSISWEVLECVKLNEEDTTSSSRIYIKILFQELAEYMGLKKLNDRLQDPTLQMAFSGIFPRDNPKNTRFSINFFTSIGLGGLTDELREHLKQMPKNVPAVITEIKLDSDSSSSSSSSDSSSSDSSSSDSEEENGKQKKGQKDKKQKSNKTAKTPEKEESTNKNDKVERWGHDGFYDTYGSDARRNESRPNKEREGNAREPQSSRHNIDERRRQNSDTRNNRENYRSDNHRKEAERGSQNDSTYRQNDDRRKNNDETDRRHDNDRSGKNKGYEDSTRCHSNRENEDRYSKDTSNRQENIDDNDQRRGREREHNQLDRRFDDRNSRRERSGYNNNRPYERVDTTSRDDRNDDRSSRNERNDRNKGVGHDQEGGKSYDSRDSRTNKSENNKEYERDGNRYSNRDSRNTVDKYHDSRNQNKDDNDLRKISRKDGGTNKHGDTRNRHDDDDWERNKNSVDDNRQTERHKNNKDSNNVESSKRVQEKDTRYSKGDDKRSKKDQQAEKNKNYDSSDGEQNDRRKSKKSVKKDMVQNNRESRDHIVLSKKANKEKNEKRNVKKKDKERKSDNEESSHKRKDHKKGKSKDKIQDKRNKNKDKENESKDASATSDSFSSDSSESSEDSRNGGGRYWDTFDIASKESSTKTALEGTTPEKSGKHYERRRALKL